MSVTIAPEDPLSPESRALIDGSEAALRAVYSADECFTFTAEELAKPEIRFFVARRQGKPIGCGALCDCGDFGEIKRLFVVPEERGNGVATALMARLERTARAAGLRVVRLETGPRLAQGVRLYQRLGYRERGPFGAYKAHPASLFMEKKI